MVKQCLSKGQNSSNMARSLPMQSSRVLAFHASSEVGPAMLMSCAFGLDVLTKHEGYLMGWQLLPGC